MTVLEWLKARTRYSFNDDTLTTIALDRGCDPSDDFYGGTVTDKQKELMKADIIFTAVLLSPSNTSSLSQSHDGFQKTIGQEQDFYQDKKIAYAIQIYKKYDDENAAILESTKKKIKQIPIVDVIAI